MDERLKMDVRAETVKLLEGNIGVHPHRLGLGISFFKITPKSQTAKEKLVN